MEEGTQRFSKRHIAFTVEIFLMLPNSKQSQNHSQLKPSEKNEKLLMTNTKSCSINKRRTTNV